MSNKTLPEDQQKKETGFRRTWNTRQQKISDYVSQNNLIPMKCDYFGITKYYYDDTNHIMYAVETIGNENPVFRRSYDQHILQINGKI